MKDFVSADSIRARVVSSLNITDDSIAPKELVNQWIFEAMGAMDKYEQHFPEIAEITITNGVGQLPCDFYKEIYVSYNGYGLTKNALKYYYSYSNTPEGVYPKMQEMTYDIRPPYIHVNKDVTILMEYLALAVDDCGQPLIPDMESVKKYLFWFVIQRMMLRGYKHPDPSINFFNLEAKVNMAKVTAEGEMMFPSLAEADNTTRMIFRRIPMRQQYGHAWRQLNTREDLELQGRTNYARRSGLFARDVRGF
jgi:hypothetical protein